MYRIISLSSVGHRTEDKTSSYVKAEKMAWNIIRKDKVHTVEIWMGELFQGRIKKEGHI
jgi:hypothetical protein